MASRYKAAKGAQYSHADAQIIGEYLENIGEFTPELVLGQAESTGSPLHKYFEWDDTVAARKHRLLQARQIVNHLLVVIRINGKDTETKAFHSIAIEVDEEPAGREYSSFSIVVNDEDRRAQVIDRALGEVEGWRERYAQYSNIFGGVFGEVEKVKTRRKKTQKKKAAA